GNFFLEFKTAPQRQQHRVGDKGKNAAQSSQLPIVMGCSSCYWGFDQPAAAKAKDNTAAEIVDDKPDMGKQGLIKAMDDVGGLLLLGKADFFLEVRVVPD